MKKSILTLALGLLAMGASAQISTGESTASVIRTGNRAKAGDFGIYFGATTDIFKNIGKGSDVDFAAIPLINLKYMKTDKREYRLGIEWWRKNEYGEQKEDNGDESKKTNSSKSMESRFMLYPGIAYHFSNKNLLDVYVGAELPVGYATYGYKTEYDGVKDDLKAKSFRIGLGGFIGLQAYVGKLPLALGVEYGLSTMYQTRKNAAGSRDGYTFDYSAFDTMQGIECMEDAKGHKFELGHQVRVTLSYYFNL